MLSKETVPLTSDGILRPLPVSPACCPSVCFCLSLFVCTRHFLHKILATLPRLSPCYSPSQSPHPRPLPRPLASLQLSVNVSCHSVSPSVCHLHVCMSILRDIRRANFQLFPSSLASLLAGLLAFLLAFLLACLLACRLAQVFLSRKLGRRPHSEGCSASDGWIFGFATCTWITSLILMRTCLSRSQIRGWVVHIALATTLRKI